MARQQAPMTDTRQQVEFALVNERELRLLMGLPFVMLAIATALAVAIDHGSASKLITEAALASASGVWMAIIVLLRRRWHGQERLMLTCCGVLIGLMAALVLTDPIFGFYAWTGYFWPGVTLRFRWRFPTFALVATVVGTSQHGGLPASSSSSWLSWIAFVAINLLAATAVTRFARTREEEHARRQEVIDELTAANSELEASLAENAGLHAQLLAQAREAGMLDERQRMAGEIHDTLAQGLVGIITQLEAASQAPAGSHEWSHHHEAAVELARESLAEARRSVQALAPAQLEHALLADALRSVAAKWSGRSGVSVSVAITGQQQALSEETELALLRVAQEALANVAKHAHASRVVLTLSYMRDLISLDVRDDGIGFVSGSPSPRRAGFGLTSMRQRIEALAGCLEIESGLGAGTTIAASVPIVGAETSSHPPAPHPIGRAA